jgi:hypothetical protein
MRRRETEDVRDDERRREKEEDRRSGETGRWREEEKRGQDKAKRERGSEVSTIPTQLLASLYYSSS